MKNIADNLPSFENNHITLLINQFIIKYILNAPPNMYNIVSIFIESLLVHCNNRLVVGWSAPSPLTTNRLLHSDDNIHNSIHNSSNSSTIEVYYYNIYKLCSIPNTQGSNSNIHGINNDIIELVRERIISTYTRTLSDLLSSLACLQGPLAEKPQSTSATTTTTGTGICIYTFIYLLNICIYIHMYIYTGNSGTGESENMEPNNGGAPILPSSLKKSNKGKSKRKLIISTPAVVGLSGGGDGEGSLAGSDKLLEVYYTCICVYMHHYTHALPCM